MNLNNKISSNSFSTDMTKNINNFKFNISRDILLNKNFK